MYLHASWLVVVLVGRAEGKEDGDGEKNEEQDHGAGTSTMMWPGRVLDLGIGAAVVPSLYTAWCQVVKYHVGLFGYRGISRLGYADEYGGPVRLPSQLAAPSLLSRPRPG